MSDDLALLQLRAMAHELGPEAAARRVGIATKTALRFLAGLPVKPSIRARIAAFFAANPGRPSLSWSHNPPPAAA